MTKEEYLKLLHEDPMFKAALNIAKEDSEKAAAASLAEQFVLSFYGLIEDMRKEAEEDPDGFLKKKIRKRTKTVQKQDLLISKIICHLPKNLCRPKALQSQA